MTDQYVREMAAAALTEISKLPKAQVFAARRGIVGGFQARGQPIVCFRRLTSGVVRMETWPPSDGEIGVYSLPPDLQASAGKMLDQL